MSQILAHPFRIRPNGTVAVVEQNSDEANAQQLAVLCLTEIGERPLEPGFGITDPTFDAFHAAELTAAVQVYGPDVQIVDVTATYEGQSSQLITIDFQ